MTALKNTQQLIDLLNEVSLTKKEEVGFYSLEQNNKSNKFEIRHIEAKFDCLCKTMINILDENESKTFLENQIFTIDQIKKNIDEYKLVFSVKITNSITNKISNEILHIENAKYDNETYNKFNLNFSVLVLPTSLENGYSLSIPESDENTNSDVKNIILNLRNAKSIYCPGTHHFEVSCYLTKDPTFQSKLK